MYASSPAVLAFVLLLDDLSCQQGSASQVPTLCPTYKAHACLEAVNNQLAGDLNCSILIDNTVDSVQLSA